jgi:hypothetical protein
MGGALIVLVAGSWISAGPGTLDDLRELEASVEGRVIVTAEVTSCRDHVAYIERTDSKNRRTTDAEEQAYYGYRYEVDGRPYSGGGMLKDASCPAPLGTVEVYYSPGAPAESLMVDIHRGKRWELYFSIACMFILSSLMSVGAILLLWWPGGSSKPPAS